MKKQFMKTNKKWMSIRAPDQWDYETYQFTVVELAKYAGIGVLFLVIIAELFFHRLLFVFILLPLLYVFLKDKEQEKAEDRRTELEKEFRDLLISVQASLQAGLSVENSFLAAYKDMLMLYGKNADIVYELSKIQKDLGCNKVLEEILSDFGRRSHCQDIHDFSQIFLIAKKCGGNMIEVMSHTVQIIEDNMAVRNELEIVLAEKKLEQKIMLIMPIFILLYLSLTSKGFFDPMYESVMGMVIMAACLAGYVISYVLLRKMIRIKV